MNIRKRTHTGRDWGDKHPFKVMRKFVDDGVRCAEVEADFWDGPTKPGERGQYERIRWIERTNLYRPSACSFDSQIRAALA